MVAVGGLDAVTALLSAAKVLFPHEAGDAIASVALSLFAQRGGDARTAVGFPALMMNLGDLVFEFQPLIHASKQNARHQAIVAHIEGGG